MHVNNKLRKIYLHYYYSFKYGDRIMQNGLSDYGKNIEISIAPKAEMRLGTIRSERNLLLASAGNGILTIGNVFFNQNCIVISRNKINIKDGCLFGPNVMVYDHDHIFNASKGVDTNDYKVGTVVIEENCWIGGGTIILKDTHIGAGSVIGAGCVIKGDIPAHSIVTADRTVKIRNIVDR